MGLQSPMRADGGQELCMGTDTFSPSHCARSSSKCCMSSWWFESIMLGNEWSVHAGGLHSPLVWTSMLSLMLGPHYMNIWSGSASLVSSKSNLFIVLDPVSSLHQDVVSEDYWGIHLRSALLLQTECWGQPSFLMPSPLEEPRPWELVAILCHGVIQNILDERQLNDKSPLASYDTKYNYCRFSFNHLLLSYLVIQGKRWVFTFLLHTVTTFCEIFAKISVALRKSVLNIPNII